MVVMHPFNASSCIHSSDLLQDAISLEPHNPLLVLCQIHLAELDVAKDIDQGDQMRTMRLWRTPEW